MLIDSPIDDSTDIPITNRVNNLFNNNNVNNNNNHEFKSKILVKSV